MSIYKIEVSDSTIYYDVEAKNEEEAIRKAWDWWIQRKPKFEAIPTNTRFYLHHGIIYDEDSAIEQIILEYPEYDWDEIKEDLRNGDVFDDYEHVNACNTILRKFK